MTVITDVTEIARILGLSRQAATELADSAPDFPAPEARLAKRPIWARRQVEAWAATHPDRGAAWRRPSTSRAGRPPACLYAMFVLAAKQSKELEHGWIGDEHLLLGLLHPDCPGAARAALESFGLTREAVRRALIEVVGDSFPTLPTTPIPLSRSTQYLLERTNLKAIELRDSQVSSEHALLALLEAPADSRALALLASAGVEPKAVAQRVIALTDRSPSGSEAAGGAPALSSEVHAAEVARILGVSRGQVAGLGASAPDFPCSRLAPRGYRVWSRPAVESWAAAHPDRGPQRSRLRPPVAGTCARNADEILAIARREANELNHTSVLTDHLFLALLHPDCPGEARAVLDSLGLALEQLRRRYVESMGDPYKPYDRELVIPPATHQALEQATLAALELEDETVTGAHILIALTQGWMEDSPLGVPLGEVRATTLLQRLMTKTDGMMPASELDQRPHSWRPPTRIPHPPEPQLAPSPAGHDPKRRRPWCAVVFDIAGKPWSLANGEYSVDRDGYAVLTTEGRPVSSLKDKQGRIVLDEEGNGILTVVEVPEGSEVRSYPRHV